MITHSTSLDAKIKKQGRNWMGIKRIYTRIEGQWKDRMECGGDKIMERHEWNICNTVKTILLYRCEILWMIKAYKSKIIAVKMDDVLQEDHGGDHKEGAKLTMNRYKKWWK